jgi:hypothetical protein
MVGSLFFAASLSESALRDEAPAMCKILCVETAIDGIPASPIPHYVTSGSEVPYVGTLLHHHEAYGTIYTAYSASLHIYVFPLKHPLTLYGIT